MIKLYHLIVVTSSCTLTDIIPAEKNNPQNVNNTNKPEQPNNNPSVPHDNQNT